MRLLQARHHKRPTPSSTCTGTCRWITAPARRATPRVSLRRGRRASALGVTALSWPPRSVSGLVACEYLGAAVMPDQENIVGLATVLRSHAGGAVGHAWNSQADRIGTFIEQPPDVGGRDVALDEIAVDLARVAGDHVLRNAIVELVADQERAEAVLGRDRHAIDAQDLHPGLAAAAVAVLQDMNGGRALGKAHLRREGGEAGGADKQATAGQYGHDLSFVQSFVLCHPAAFSAQPITRTCGTVRSGSSSAAFSRPVTSRRTRISV